MSESHRSLSGDFACATASIDELCQLALGDTWRRTERG